MKFKLKAYSIWEVGKRKDDEGKPHQEDSLYPPHGALDDTSRLFILCDGMGGHDSGEVASATVCSAMSKYILSACPDSGASFSDEKFREALSMAYKALDRVDNGAVKKMGTTMTFLKFYEGGAFLAHIGDSRIYHIRPGETGSDTEILYVTEDHSLVNQLVKIGRMTPEEARNSGRKNIITRAMQPNQDYLCQADVHHVTDIQPGDYFYMCSDGMLEQEGMENGTSLRNIFSHEGGDDANKLDILVKATADNADNHTAIIVHITDVEGVPINKTVDASTIIPLLYDSRESEMQATPDNKCCRAITCRHRFYNIMFWVMLLVAVIIALVVFVLPVLKTDENPISEQPSENIDVNPDTPLMESKPLPPMPTVHNESEDSICNSCITIVKEKFNRIIEPQEKRETETNESDEELR